MTKKPLCLAFESITVVWLSSYRSLSVNAVSPISHKKVCMCAVKRLWSVWFWVSATGFLISSLYFSSCLPGLDLSLQSMPLFPVCFEEITDRLLLKTSVKWKGTDNKKLIEKEWTGKRLGQIAGEGEREAMAENNIMRREMTEGEGERERGQVPIKLITPTRKPSTDCSLSTHTKVT